MLEVLPWKTVTPVHQGIDIPSVLCQLDYFRSLENVCPSAVMTR
jgi:hypothetical protein